jgi:hypothetical protein
VGREYCCGAVVVQNTDIKAWIIFFLQMLPVEAIIGISVGLVALVLIALIVVVALVCCCRKGENGGSFTRVGENRSATTNV